MADVTSISQGDSYAEDFSNVDIPVLDSDWGGDWAIVAELYDALTLPNPTPLASGTLTLSTDNTKLELRILPTDTEAIPVGTYKLVVQAKNATLFFCKEIVQRTLKITVQGIPVN
jgi:hypothetical protein